MKRFLILTFSLLFCVSVLAQERVTVSGIVTDAGNNPLVGVGVVQQGTTNGVITDIDGYYQIGVPEGSILEFSCLGYDSVIRTAVAGTLDVTLDESTMSIDELVVVGYGVQKKSDLTGSISTVGVEDLANRSITSVDNGLQGKTAGVHVVTTSGAPGAETSIRVRGYSSNSDSTPLYVVDGLRTRNIAYLDPSDIESIEVLKDGASAAIYGAQAGNGVILVTTKKGAEGTSRISYDMQLSRQNIGRIPEVLNAQEYIQWAVIEGGLVTQSRFEQYYDGVTDTNWADVAFENGYMQRHNLSFSGANKNGSLFASLAYVDSNGPVIGNEDVHKRLSGTINATYQFKPWLSISSNNSFSKFNTTRVREGEGAYSMLGSVIQMDPLTPVVYSKDNLPDFMQNLLDLGRTLLTDENGDYYSMSPFQDTNNVNPYIMRESYTQSSEGFIFRGSTSLNIQPLSTVTFTSRLGYDYLNRSYYNLLWPHTVTTDTYYDYVGIEAGNSTTGYYQWENFVNYNETFGGKHNVNVMAGMSFSERNTFSVTGSVYGDGADNIGITKLDKNYAYFDNASGTAIKEISGGEKRTYTELSYFGRVGYDYASKYYIQASLRADAADLSILPLNNRWGFFPAVSVGWTISREDFFRNLGANAISFLKFRASWGQNGSIAGLSDYMYAANIVSDLQYPFEDGSYSVGSMPSATGNDNLKWETSEQLDFGLDLRMFDDRLAFTMDWYRKETKDLIMSSVTSSLVVGNTLSPLNAGNVLNTGFEFDFSWKDKVGDFSYGISANLATLHNEVTYIYSTLTRVAGDSAYSGVGCYFEEGYPIWYMRGFNYLGVNPDDGSPIFEDVNGDGIISDDDMTMIGSGIPDLTYGLTLNLAWKGIDLIVFVNGTVGNEICYAIPRGTRMQSNTLKYFYDRRWTTPGQNAEHIAASLPDYTNYLRSSALVFDGSYLKIKQIQLGYTFPNSLLEKTKFLSNLRVYISLDDYFTFTEYPGFDPEVSISGSGLGLDYGQYPVTKRMTFGINVSF